MRLIDRLTALVVCVLATACWALAGTDAGVDASPPAPPAKAQPTSAPAVKVTPEQIAQWIKNLDDNSSRVRDEATKQLTRAAQAAIDPVAQAAKGTSLEVTTRAVEVLKSLLTSEDDATKRAAQAALDKLAADKEGEAGRQAREALEAQRRGNQSPQDRRVQQLLGGQGFVVRGGAIQIQGGQVAVQIAVANANGQRNVNVQENGKKIEIQEDNKGIVVTVTEPAKDNQKAEPKVYKAANADELKKKHPEAYKMYEKYAKNDGAAVVIGNIGVGPAVAPPMPVPAMRARTPRVSAVQARRLIAEAQKELQKSQEALKAAANGKADAKALQEILRQVETVQKQLADALQQLGG